MPAPARRRLLRLDRLRRPQLPAEEIALELAEYAVPVELVECSSLGELGRISGLETDDLAAAV